MKRLSKPVRIFAALAVSATLLTGISTSAVAVGTGPSAEQQQQWAQKHQDRIKARLAKTAQTLTITPAQQPAWDAFAAAVESSIPAHGPRPAGDAAAIAKARSERAADHAKRMSTLADATAALQAVLTPEQRKTFDQIASRADRHGHHGHHGFRHHGAMSDAK